MVEDILGDLLLRQGLLGQDGKAVLAHVGEAAADRTRRPLPGVSVTTRKPGLERRHQRRMAGQHRHIALARRAGRPASTSPENRMRSGRDEFEGEGGHGLAVNAGPFGSRAGLARGRSYSRVGIRVGLWTCSAGSRLPEGGRASMIGLRRLGGEALGLLDGFLDGADHVEGRLREVVVLAFDEALEALDRVGERDELAGRAGEDFGDEEGLRQEALDLAGARDRRSCPLRRARPCPGSR